MIALSASTAERTVRHGVTWDEFESLLAANSEGPLRLAYSDGVLETVVPSIDHERRNRTLALFVETAALEAGLDFDSLGSATIRRPDLLKGVEPDSCYVFGTSIAKHGRPPDLVIEVDVTNDSTIKMPVFAALGIPEVWHQRGDSVLILVLRGAQYIAAQSLAFPGLDGPTLARFFRQRTDCTAGEWCGRIREWVRTTQPSASAARPRQPRG